MLRTCDLLETIRDVLKGLFDEQKVSPSVFLALNDAIRVVNMGTDPRVLSPLELRNGVFDIKVDKLKKIFLQEASMAQKKPAEKQLMLDFGPDDV